MINFLYLKRNNRSDLYLRNVTRINIDIQDGAELVRQHYGTGQAYKHHMLEKARNWSSENVILIGGECNQVKTLFLLAITWIYFPQSENWTPSIKNFGFFLDLNIRKY